MQTPDYLLPYEEEVDDHGAGFNATLWANEQSQHLRFKAMAESVDLSNQTVLDAGCSRGDFAAYLLKHGHPYKAFIGVDGIAPVIEAAKGRNLPRTEFYAADFVQSPSVLGTGEPDVVCLSGTLNTMDLPMAIGLLKACWQHTQHTLVFNFLPTTCGPKAPAQAYPAKRLDTHKLLTWAFEQTPSVVYRQDYFPHAHDGMVVMRKVREIKR